MVVEKTFAKDALMNLYIVMVVMKIGAETVRSTKAGHRPLLNVRFALVASVSTAVILRVPSRSAPTVDCMFAQNARMIHVACMSIHASHLVSLFTLLEMHVKVTARALCALVGRSTSRHRRDNSSCVRGFKSDC